MSDSQHNPFFCPPDCKCLRPDSPFEPENALKNLQEELDLARAALRRAEDELNAWKRTRGFGEKWFWNHELEELQRAVENGDQRVRCIIRQNMELRFTDTSETRETRLSDVEACIENTLKWLEVAGLHFSKTLATGQGIDMECLREMNRLADQYDDLRCEETFLHEE